MRRQKLETKQLYHPNYRDKNAAYMHKFIRKHCKKRVRDCQTDRRAVYQAVRVL